MSFLIRFRVSPSLGVTIFEIWWFRQERARGYSLSRPWFIFGSPYSLLKYSAQTPFLLNVAAAYRIVYSTILVFLMPLLFLSQLNWSIPHDRINKKSIHIWLKRMYITLL